MTSMAECVLANEWWCGVAQDALRASQLAADRKRDVWLPQEMAEARRKTWESGLSWCCAPKHGRGWWCRVSLATQLAGTHSGCGGFSSNCACK